MPPRGGARGAQGGRLRAGSGARPGSSAPSVDHCLAALRDAVPNLDLVSSHLLGIPAASTHRSVASLNFFELSYLHDIMRGHMSPYVHGLNSVRLVLQDKPILAALLRLVVAGASVPAGTAWRVGMTAGQVTSDAMLAQRALHEVPVGATWLLKQASTTSLHHPVAMWDLMHDIIRRLLRMGALDRAAQQAAEAAAALRRPGTQLPQNETALWPWDSCLRLVALVVFPATAPQPLLADCGPDTLARCTQLRLEVAAALASSRVLEHAAQGLVLLAHHPGFHAGALPTMRRMQGHVYQLLDTVVQACRTSSGPDQDAAFVLMHALLPPRVQLFNVSVGLAVLCAADGGPSLGLDVQRYGMLSPLDDHAVPQRYSLTTWLSMLHALFPRWGEECMRNDRACALLLRMGRAALACAGPGAAAPTRGSAAARARALDPEDGERLVLGCLTSLTERIVPALDESAVLEPLWADSLRLGMDMASMKLRGSHYAGGTLADVLGLQLDTLKRRPDGSHSDAALRAAASGGVLPWVEGLMRAAGRTELGSPPNALFRELPLNLDLMPLLLLVEPVDAAAFVVTLGKLVRRNWAAPNGMISPATYILLCLVTVLDRIPGGHARATEGDPARSGVEGGAPPTAASQEAQQLQQEAQQQQQQHEQQQQQEQQQQLAQAPEPMPEFKPCALLSLLVHELVPAMACWVRDAAPDAAHTACVVEVWQAVLSWTSLVCARAADEAGHPTTRVALQELMERLKVVELVGCAMRFLVRALQQPRGSRGQGPDLDCLMPAVWVDAALTVARTQADEVCAAASGAVGAEGGSSGGGEQAGGSAGRPGGVGSRGSSLRWPVAELLQLMPMSAPLKAGLEQLGQQLELWSTGAVEVRLPCMEAPAAVSTWSLSYLVPHAEARGPLRTCSNLGCVELKGDSEAGLGAGLLRCGGCGAAWYCCKGCQLAHWRAGHKAACAKAKERAEGQQQ